MTKHLSTAMAVALFVALMACDSSPAPSTTWSAHLPAPLLLARHPEAVTRLELPDDSRGGVPVPEKIPVSGPYRLRRTVDGVHSFDAPLPIRPRVLFFSSAPRGMSVEADGRHLVYRRGSSADGKDRSWLLSS